jgi:predicted dehydrogenase
VDRARLGVVGLGWWGGMLAESAGASGLATIVGGYARTPERRDAFADQHDCRAFDDLDAMLSDEEVDGVLVATPHSTHVELVQQIASAGKHVFVEKPLALTADDAKRAIAATDAAGVTLQVGHNRRRQPANRRIKAMIEDGELGTLVHLEGNQSGPNAHADDFPAWRADPQEAPGGGMSAMGVHVVDTFHYWAGPAKRVFAYSKRIAGWRELDEATAVTIEYEAGPLGSIGTSYYVPAVNTLVAYGTDANAWNEQDGRRFFSQRRGEPARTEAATDTIDTIVDEMAEFARCILEGAHPETGGREGLEVAAVLEAIVRSSTSGCAIELSDLR